MKAGYIKIISTPVVRIGTWASLAFLLAIAVRAESILTTGSLGLVEYRALLAQSLIQQVEEMKGESDVLRKQLDEKESLLKDALEQLNKSRKEIATLQQSLTEWERELEKRDKLLAVFRRGAFEYYEVRTGDTLESIAANPMVYNDASRAVWLRQANSLSDRDAPVPGTVLIIPRFPEGTTYDL